VRLSWRPRSPHCSFVSRPLQARRTRGLRLLHRDRESHKPAERLPELRRAQRRAVGADGRPTFPALHARGADGKRLGSPRGAIPCFHSLRHTCASWAIADGDGAEEVSWQLGHKDSIATREVYISEVRSVERTARRRSLWRRVRGLSPRSLCRCTENCRGQQSHLRTRIAFGPRRVLRSSYRVRAGRTAAVKSVVGNRGSGSLDLSNVRRYA
jgi:hypothetical protein